jgi:hypothetical protein
MQPTEIQVQRCLHALETPPDVAPGDFPPYESLREVGLDTVPDSVGDDMPEGLVELLSGSSGVRLQRMADARMRLAAGEQPTDDDLAARLVGRLVCDRIR